MDFWNTFGKHDSLFQKSPLLSPSGGDRLCKTRRFQNLRVPKDVEFAPHGVSSKIRRGSSLRLVVKSRYPDFCHAPSKVASVCRWRAGAPRPIALAGMFRAALHSSRFAKGRTSINEPMYIPWRRASPVSESATPSRAHNSFTDFGAEPRIRKAVVARRLRSSRPIRWGGVPNGIGPSPVSRHPKRVVVSFAAHASAGCRGSKSTGKRGDAESSFRPILPTICVSLPFSWARHFG